jgi:hypothetical protein
MTLYKTAASHKTSQNSKTQTASSIHQAQP